jgi:hypothetical protein
MSDELDLFPNDRDPERMPRRIALAAGGYSFTSPTWHCEVHGDTALVFTVFLPGVPGASYCLPCVLSVLERLGLKPLPRVD